MVDRYSANQKWCVTEPDGTTPTWERAGIAVLMDIRQELQQLNRLLSCPSFCEIPRTLRKIRENTQKTRRRQKQGSKVRQRQKQRR